MRRMLLSPLFSGPLLFAVTFAPERLYKLLAKIGWATAWDQHASTIAAGLRALFGVSIAWQLNRALNTMAANSWRLTAAKGWDWPKEIAVVTGGCSGIGKDIVERLSALGVRVAVLDIQALPKAMENDKRIHFYQCDVTSSESIAAAANALREELGHPSILVNNAGIARPMNILTIPEAVLRQVFSVNILSMWLTTQQFLPHMIQANKGHVVTVASIASFVALPTAADYSASKAGALAFHESLACELKHCYNAPNVLTTVVHPNFVRTPLVQDFADNLERSGVRMLTSEQVADPIVEQIKSRRGGQLIIPASATPISGIRGWPTWLQELLRDALGRESL